MSDLSSLQIQISASSTQADNAIDKLINHLGALNRALNNYSAGSDYVKGLKNLSDGLTGISTAVSSIDLAKIKELSSVLKSLSGAGSKIASLNIAKSITAMSAGAESASKKMRELATSFAGEHGITNPKAISELTEEITKLSQAANDPAASQQSLRNIENIIHSYEKYGDAVDETYEKVRRFVSDSSIYLSKMDVSEFADDFAHMHGVLGIENTTTDPRKGVGLDTWLTDFQEQFKGVLPELTATQDIMSALVEYLDKGKEAADKYAREMDSCAQNIEFMNDSLQRLADTLGVVKSEQSDGLFDDDLDLVFGNEFEDVTASAKEAQTSLTGVAQTVSDIKEEVVGNPFEGLVNGLTSLDGISITGEQFSGLKTISESLGKLGGKYAASAATNLPQIADGIQKIASISIPDIGDQLASLAAGVAKFGSKAATRAQNLPQFVEGLRQLATIPAIPQIEGLDSLAQSLSMFGRKTAQQAVTTIPQLAAAFRSLIDTMASAPNVSENTIRFAYALAAVTANGSRAGSMLRSLTTNTNLFSRSARKASKSTKGLASFFGKLYAKYFLLIRAIRSLGTAISYSSSLTEVENVVETTFGNATDVVQEFSDQAIMSFGMSELSAKQFASRFQAMGAAMGITTSQVAKSSEYLAGVIPQTERVQKLYGDLGDSMADVSVNLTKLTADMASFYNTDYEDVAEDMQAVFTGMTRPLRKYGLDLTQATLKEFALANGLDADISKMTQAQKTMLRYQYVMANMGHVMGDFDKTMNNWANVTRTIGQQFQKMGQLIGEGLINTFKPYLIAFRDFMNTLIDLTEKALNAIGKLLGWEVQIEHVGTTISDDMSDYADSVDDAAGSAKELKKMLLGIDELNLLPSNSDGGSGSGTSGGGAGASALTDYTGEFEFKKYESDIESWFDFGRRISEKIREGLNIDWSEKFEGAKNFGTNLAEFLNGLITPETFSAVGEAVAGSIMTAIYGAKAFGEKFNWENLGTSIAGFVNGALETFNFGDIADTIDVWVQGLWTAIKSAIKGINKDDAASAIGDFFGNLDQETVEIVIGAILIKKVGKWVFGGGVWKLFQETIGKEIAKAFASMGGLGGVLTADLGTVFGAGTAAEIGATIGTGIAGGILAGIAGFWAGKKLGKLIFPDDASYYDDFKWFGEGGFFDTLFGSIKDGTFTDAVKNMWKDLTPQGQTITAWNELKDKVDEFGGASKVAEKIWSESKLGQSVSDTVNSMKNNIDLGISNIKNSFESFKSYLTTLWTNISNNVISWWNGTVKPWFQTNVAPWFTVAKWKELGGNIWTSLTQTWDKLKLSASNTWESIKLTIKKAIDSIKEFLNFDWKWPTIKTPHISWTEGGATATGVVKAILEALSLPTSLPKMKVDWYAQGGFPDTGSLFVANEAGPELVGTIGGQTAVANQSQIVEAVAQGVASAVSAVLGNGNRGGQTIQMVVDGKVLYQTVVNENNRQIQRTGASALRA